MRYHRFSLAEPPVMLGVGNHLMNRDSMEWYEPPDRFLLLMLWHSGTLIANGVPFPFTPATIFVIPPRTRCRIDRLGGEDRTQFWGHFFPNESRAGMMAVPFQTSFRERAAAVKSDILSAEDLFIYCQSYSKAIVWTTLWNIAEDPSKARANLTVERAEELIHERIGTDIRVSDLAKEVMLSHNQLTRSFVRELGVTPREYIRNLRLDIAVRLLTTSTLPIKQIAVRVGVPDLRQFNRLVRDRLGNPPRVVRANRQTLDLNRHQDD